jgi:hypothetical protein
MSSPSPEIVSQIESKISEVEAIKLGPWFRYPETWNNTLESLGAAYLKDSAFVDDAIEEVRGNSITLESAANAVGSIYERLTELQKGLSSVIDGFESLGLTDREPEDRDAELSVLMPRAAFRNELRAFSKDVLEIAKFLELAEEISTGSRQPVLLQELSTTDPVVIAGVSFPACLLVLKMIRDIPATIKSTYELREARAKALVAEASAKTLESMDADVRDRIDAGLKAAIEALNANLGQVQEARRAELRTELEMVVPKMAARIDNGYRIEGHVRSNVAEDASDEKKEKVAQIVQISGEVSYRKLPKTPVLQLQLAFDSDDKELSSKKRH